MRSLLMFVFISLQYFVFAQETSKINIIGTVSNAVTGEPLKQVLISISGTSVSTSSDSTGKFEISGVDANAMIIARLPEFDTREIYLYGRNSLEIKLLPDYFKSSDDLVVTPYEDLTSRKIATSFQYFTKPELEKSTETSFERIIQGKATGLKISTLSGMPGALSVMGMRGYSSIFGKNEPVVIIDGVLHEIQYPSQSGIDGFVHNPLEMVDIEDIESITIMKDALSYLGSLGSNGAIVINTEEKKETSAAIRLHMYQGVIMPSKTMDLMNANQFNNLLTNMISSENLSKEEISARYPWLSGEGDPYYSNNTDWQDEIFKSGIISKYHIFLKGGDNIGNLNMSTGYLKHNGIVENTSYSRFNLRINSIVNITNRFSFTPNIKLSTSDSYLMEQGPNDITNPIIAASLKAPITMPYSVKGTTNDRYIKDADAFPVSNPVAIVKSLTATNKNYQFLASGKAKYYFFKKLSVATNLSITYNSSRDNIFVPDKGLLTIDSANNSMRAMVTEYRSLQNNFVANYVTNLNEKINLDWKIGNRIMTSKYEFDSGFDLNSATDDFRSLGSGAEDQFLRTTTGSNRALNFMSFYTIADFSYLDKFYVNASLSADGNSMLNENNRYNFYYSLAAAWNVLSGKASLASRLEALKLKASYGKTGNIFNNVYDYSKLYYVGKRIFDQGVLIRESIPNEDMEVEKKSTANIGIDLSTLGHKFNASIDAFYAMTNNLIFNQRLPNAAGFSNYYNNLGAMTTMGVELSADYRFRTGQSVWNIGLTASSALNEITEINKEAKAGDENYYLTEIDDTQNSGLCLITEEGKPMFSFYGYETNGVYYDENEASQIIGPNGSAMHAGDVRFVDQDNNNVIDLKDSKNLGNADPLVYGAIFANFQRGRIKASVNCSYSYGGKIYNYLAMRTHSLDNYYNQSADAIDGGQPRLAYGDPSGNNFFSDRWIEDGTYLKIKNVSVSYTLPTINSFYKFLEVYVTGSNLYTFTKYTGYDPESLYINDIRYAGIDYGKIPFGRSVIVGIKLGL